MIYLAQQYLDHSAASYPTQTAVVCGESRITYAELYHTSNQLANCLCNHGIGRQDRVAIFLRRSSVLCTCPKVVWSGSLKEWNSILPLGNLPIGE